jgi:phosphohistidine phosphatase
MKLYLVRHGEALSPAKDPGRSLSPDGQRGVERIALFLREAGVRLNFIYHSEKTRAAQTAAILGSVIAPEAEVAEVMGLLPEDPIEPILEHVGRWQEDRMLVGHLPFMSRLSSTLLAKATVPVSISFPPACVICVENCPEEYWAFRWMIEPGMLP